MPPVTPSRILAITPRAAPPKRGRYLNTVARLDLALRDFFQGDREVILRRRFDHWRRELLEDSLAERVVVVVDLTGALGCDDDGRVMAVDVLQQDVDAWIDHATMLAKAPRGPAAPA